MTFAARTALAAMVLVCFAAAAASTVIMDRIGVAAALALPVLAVVTALVWMDPIRGVQLAVLAIPLEFFSVRVGGDAGVSATEGLMLLTAACGLLRWCLPGAARPAIHPVFV